MEKTLDPRFVRTRQLIMDAFMRLVIEKEFKDITIKDITESATINRATFYYHFFDKYDLMVCVLSEHVLKDVLKDVTSHESLTAEALKDIFYSLISFQSDLSKQCSRSYEAFTPKIEAFVKDELCRAFKSLLKQEYPSWSSLQLEMRSTMLSWSLYGMSTKFVRKDNLPSKELMAENFRILLNQL